MTKILRCECCKKEPSEIGEYKRESKEYGLTPEEFVIREDGTYNPASKTFICTTCLAMKTITQQYSQIARKTIYNFKEGNI